MSQRTIELHDSVIATIVLDGGTTLITFSHAYIHQSDGVPGVDPGSGWSQRAELRINRSSINTGSAGALARSAHPQFSRL